MRHSYRKSINYIILSLILLILLNVSSFFILTIMKKMAYHELTKDYLSLPNFKGDLESSNQIFIDYEASTSEYVPFIGWKRKPFKSKTLNIDNSGNRIHIYDKTKLNENSPKVYFFGGSTMWGMGVDDNHTIPALWSQINPSFEVHNMAETGHNSRQNLETLINLVSEGEKIDLAIFYEGYNDIIPVYTKNEYLHTHSQVDYILRSTSKQISIWRKVFYINTFLLANRLIGELDITNKVLEEECQETKTEMLSQETIKIWEIAKEIVENQGGKFILILQPTVYVGEPNLDHLQDILEFINFKDFAKGSECVYPKLQSFCQNSKNRSWAFDFTDIFNGQEFYYFSSCHVTANGNEKLVARIDSVLNLNHF